MDEYQAHKEICNYFGIDYNSIEYEDCLEMIRICIYRDKEWYKARKQRFNYSDSCKNVIGLFKEWFDNTRKGEYDNRLENLPHFVASSYRYFVWIFFYVKKGKI